MPNAAHTRRPHRLLSTLILFLVCVLASATLVFLYFWTGHRHTAVLVFAVLVPILWFIPFYLRLCEIVRGRYFAHASLLLDSDRPHLGQTLSVSLHFTPRRRLPNLSFRIQLRAVEEFHPQRGPLRSSQPVQTSLDLPAPDDLQPHHPSNLLTEITVPAQAMQSFEGRHVAFRWFLDAYALGKIPLLLASHELSVQPLRENYSPPADPGEISTGTDLRISLSRSSFHVGQRAHLSVTIDPVAARAAHSLQLSVLWTVSGPTPDESRTVFSKTVPPSTGSGLTSDPLRAAPIAFDFIIPPAGPISYSGRLFSVSWSAHAQLLDPDGHPILSVDLPFTVLPRPA